MIPLVVALWEHVAFGGRHRLVVADTPWLGYQDFNDLTSSVGVHPGPDYEQWKAQHGGEEPTVQLYQDVNYGGAALVLTTGSYSSIHLLYNFGDVISSVRMPAGPDAGAQHSPVPANPIAPIPLVVTIWKDIKFNGSHAVIVENMPWIGGYLGNDWNDVISAVRVEPGPNYNGERARLFRDAGWLGGSIDLDVGDYPNIGQSHGFNDVTSSVQVR
jgi:hypothetical protein